MILYALIQICLTYAAMPDSCLFSYFTITLMVINNTLVLRCYQTNLLETSHNIAQYFQWEAFNYILLILVLQSKKGHT